MSGFKFKDYKKLDRAENYDHEAAEEYAEAANEIRELESRIKELRYVLEENKDIRPFIWTTAEGKAIALHSIEEDHFKNILQHVYNMSANMPKELRAEARRRGATLPTSVQPMFGRSAKAINAEIINDPFADDDREW